MLIYFLVLSHLIYALPVWRPLLSQSNVNHLQCCILIGVHVRITALLWKFDHVSEQHGYFNCMVVSLNSMMPVCFAQGNGTVLNSPVLFGINHGHHTRPS